MSTYQIPFRNGNLQSYPYNPDEWRDNYVFEDTLIYKGYGRGRSSVTFYFDDSNGNTYEMFISDFDDLFRKLGGFTGLTISGKWTFVKKGKNYGIKAVSI